MKKILLITSLFLATSSFATPVQLKCEPLRVFGLLEGLASAHITIDEDKNVQAIFEGSELTEVSIMAEKVSENEYGGLSVTSFGPGIEKRVFYLNPRILPTTYYAQITLYKDRIVPFLGSKMYADTTLKCEVMEK